MTRIMQKRNKLRAFLLTMALIVTSVQISPAPYASAAVKKMKLSQKKMTLVPGQKKKLKVKNKKGKVKWSSSKKKVASVSKKGVVTAKKKGKAVITAKIKYKGKTTKLKCKVSVSEAKKPTPSPSAKATPVPSVVPTASQSVKPSGDPVVTAEPTTNPTENPTESAEPTQEPTAEPTAKATEDPAESAEPTATATENPAESAEPTAKATEDPIETTEPTAKPTIVPTPSITYHFSGTLFDGEDNAAGDILLKFKHEEGIYEFETRTDADGSWSVDLAPGAYEVYWNDWFQIDGSLLVQEDDREDYMIYADNILKYSGTLIRNGEPWKDIDIVFGNSWGDETYVRRVTAHSDPDTGRYSVYLNRYATYCREIDGYIRTYVCPDDDMVGNMDIDVGDLVRISGTIYQRDNVPMADSDFRVLTVDSDDDNGEDGDGIPFVTDKDGRYRIYVRKGKTVEIYRGRVEMGVKVGEFSNLDADVDERDIVCGLAHITGTLTAENGDVLSDKCIDFYKMPDTADSSLSGEKTSPVYTYTDSEGDFSIYLKPGTYTIKILDTITVGQMVVEDEDAVRDLKAPLYKISGKVYRNNSLWEDQQYLDVYWEEDDGEEGSCRIETDEDGTYCAYLPKKTVTIVAEGRSRETGQDLVVEGDAEDQDLMYQFYRVSGKIYRREGVEFGPKDSLDGWLDIVDEENERVGIIHISDSSDYELYLDKEGKYKVLMDLYQKDYEFIPTEIDSFEVTGEQTEQDIICNLYRISGTVKGMAEDDYSSLKFESEIYGYQFTNVDFDDEARIFTVYLLAGNYQAYLDDDSSEIVKNEIEVNEDKDSVQIVGRKMYKVSGTISNPSGLCEGKKVSFITDMGMKSFETSSKADGSYVIELPPGNYTIQVEGLGMGDLVVTSEDITDQDFVLDMIAVSGIVTRNGIPVTSGILSFFEKMDGDDGFYDWVIDFSDWGGEDGRYKVYLDPSKEYQVKMGSVVIGCFSTDMNDMEGNDLNMKLTKISGILRDTKGNAISDANIEFVNGGSDSDVSSVVAVMSDEEGNYSAYLKPGNYKISVFGMELSGTITVSEEDEVQDIICDKIAVSGTVTRNGIPVTGVSLSIYEKKDDDKYDHFTELWLNDEDGRYKVYLNPSKEYQVKMGSVVIGYFSTGTDDMEGNDLNIKLARLSGILRGANGNGIPDAYIKFVDCESDSGESSEMAMSEEAGSYSVYLKPGTYKVIVFGDTELPDMITVSGEDEVKDIICDKIAVSGTVTRNGIPVTSGSLSIYEKKDDDQYDYFTELWLNDEDGRYKVWLDPSKEYQIKMEAVIIDYISADTSNIENFDLDIGLTKISGILRDANKNSIPDANIKFVDCGSDSDESSVTEVNSDGEGSYSVYLKPGTYKVIVFGDTELSDTITVSKEDGVQDITCGKIVMVSGLMRDVGEAPMSNQSLEFCKRVEGGPSEVKWAYTGKNGEYSIFVNADSTYDVRWNNEVIGTVETGAGELNGQDFTLDVFEISGKVTAANGEGIPGIYMEFVHSQSSLSVMVNTYNIDSEVKEPGEYTVYLKPGTYKVIYGNTTYVLCESLSVSQGDGNYDISTKLYRVSGSCKDDYYRVYCVTSEEETSLMDILVGGKDAAYCIWLPNGKYVFVSDKYVWKTDEDGNNTEPKTVDEIDDEYKTYITVENDDVKQELD